MLSHITIILTNSEAFLWKNNYFVDLSEIVIVNYIITQNIPS